MTRIVCWGLAMYLGLICSYANQPLPRSMCPRVVGDLLKEKEQISEAYFVRIMRNHTGNNAVNCFLYQAWDDFISAVAIQMEVCKEDDISMSINKFSAELGASMEKLKCPDPIKPKH